MRDFHLSRSVSYKQPMTRLGFDPENASDIQRDSWLLRMAPEAVRPYLRLMRADRPIGTWLLLIPGLWSIAMSASYGGLGPPPAGTVLLFAVGAFVMRGAGCVVNDLWDRDIDGKVARTATRPIASGEVSVMQAMSFLAALLLVGLLILVQFDKTTIVLGIASLGLVAVYPLMKRITYWPQAFLGLTFNWGALVGWTAVLGELDTPALLMYVAGFFWTLGYDTVYGHQDKADDILVGVKSAAIKLGDRTRPFVRIFFATTLVMLAVAGTLSGLGWFYFVMLSAAGVHFAWQAATLDIDDPDNCLMRFKSNRDTGLMIFLGIIIG